MIGGTDYAPQCDFSEFYAATNNRTFRVIVAGNPFPDLSQPEMQRRLLPVMQANRPRPALTFTYDVPVELPWPDFGVYCRNDQALSQATATTAATGPEDPRVGQLLQQLFLVLFTDSPMVRRSRFPVFTWF
jgi:hypothetical protein